MMVKIDVEGYEPYVLAGMSALFDGPAPPCYLFVEIFPKLLAFQGSSADALLAFMLSHVRACVCVCVCMRERQREKDREKKTESERTRKRGERRRDRETEKEERERKRDRERECMHYLCVCVYVGARIISVLVS